MIGVKQRICMLIFTILVAVVHLDSANGFTPTQPKSDAASSTTAAGTLPTQTASKKSWTSEISLTPTPTPAGTHASAEAAASATATATAPITTTTIASSNAPATTVDATKSRAHKNEEDKIETAATTILKTMLPENLEHTLKTMGGGAEDDTMLVKTTSSTYERLDKTAATASSDGNEVKTQIKSTKKDTNTMEGLQQLPATTTLNPTVEEANASNEQEMSTMVNSMVDAKKTETLQGSSSVKTSTTTSTTLAMVMVTTEEPPTFTKRNQVQIEGQLKSDLYRITLAEVVTDEFGTVPSTSNAEIADAANKKNSQSIAQKTSVAGVAAAKVNIADLYPMKKEDFEPIIRDSNNQLLKERTIFKKLEDEAEYRQNLMPNEVETNDDEQHQQRHAATSSQAAIFANDAPKPKPQHLTKLELTLMTRDADGNHHDDADHDGDDGSPTSDLTQKLLAERDCIITEIEKKFRLNEFVPKSTTTTTTSTTTMPTSTQTAASATSKPTKNVADSSGINQQHELTTSSTEGKTPAYSPSHHFIERRVKKSFAFPMHRTPGDAMSAAPYMGFANTKFTGNVAGNGSPAAAASAVVKAKTFASDTSSPNVGNAQTQQHDGGVLVAGAAHPEFSTTKFYNSKELYNEMVMHNKLRQLQHKPADDETHSSYDATTMLPGAATRFNTMKNVKNFFVSGEPLSASKSLPSSSSLSTEAAVIKRVTLTATSATPVVAAAMPTSTSPFRPADATATTLKPKKFQKELKRAKLLLKAMLPATTTTTTTATIVRTPTKPNNGPISKPASVSSLGIFSSLTSTTLPRSTTTTNKSPVAAAITTTKTISPAAAAAASKIKTTTPADIDDDVQSHFVSLTTIAATRDVATTPQLRATNPTKSASKPIARPRVLSRLQEKINSLECEIQNVPQDSHLWRGNETHELLLPIITTKQCEDNDDNKPEHQTDCSTSSTSTATATTSASSVSWDGEAEIQSGDILIVEINDALLISQTSNTSSAHNTQVYQVTRSGHEHCDVTEGILLDITPLVVDGRKLVTLYDKDLTEGVNLLIVVSELWGSKCVRLKVTTKTDNCGENADCSGKGVCYSNTNMEEYECQCCTGFAGPHCEEIDACTPSPCTNNGICVDLSQGHEGNSYQCLCPYGYTGKNCQYESDPCNPAECMNGGTCIGNSTHFRCDCTSGFAGPLCQHSLNECESSPCVHGICVDQEDGFRCFCQPGFAGELCNFEYNECESNPCQNGGECIDHIGSYECRCTKGYSGLRCQVKVDFCANKPCPEGHRCIDHGNDFSCECPGGRNGPDCNEMARTRCNVNPCTHGGTCWSSGDSFYCACRPGFTGTMCEDEFVVETVVSSSEFIVDDTSTRNFNDKSFGSSVVLKSPIELHNAYFAAGVLAAAFFIVAVVVTICHCKVNQTYRKFSTRTTSFIPIIGFGRRTKPQSKLNKHWLSGKGLGSGGGNGANAMRSSNAATSTRGGGQHTSNAMQQQNNVGQLHERPFQRHLAMNLENDMYYTVDFSENSQHSPLIQ